MRGVESPRLWIHNSISSISVELQHLFSRGLQRILGYLGFLHQFRHDLIKNQHFSFNVSTLWLRGLYESLLLGTRFVGFHVCRKLLQRCFQGEPRIAVWQDEFECEQSELNENLLEVHQVLLQLQDAMQNLWLAFFPWWFVQNGFLRSVCAIVPIHSKTPCWKTHFGHAQILLHVPEKLHRRRLDFQALPN